MLNFLVMLMLGANFCQVTTSSPWLLISTEEDVKIVDAQTPDEFPAHLINNVVKPDAYLYYLDYHYQNGLVCWSDITQLTVQCWQHNATSGETKEQTVFVSGLTYPVGVAVDWFGDALYWADSKAGTVEVILLQAPHYRRVLYWSNLADINDIVVLPTEGLLFWSKWGDSPLIEVASMAGSDGVGGPSRRPLVSRGLNWPNGIAVDGARRLLYWADAWKNQPYIEAVAFDGSLRFKILNKELLHPFALSYFNDSLYWTDWETHAIHTCSLGAQGKCGVPRRIGSSNTTKSVRVYTPELQRSSISSCSSPSCEPASSPCSPSPCSHLCLLAPSSATRQELLSRTTLNHGTKLSSINSGPSFSCTCPTGIMLEADGRTCGDGPQQFLLLARHGGLFRVSLDTPDHSLLPLDVLGQDNETRHGAVEVDYDPVKDEIYWVDDELKAVRATREFSSGAVVTRTVLEELGSADGFALDVRGRNLYWTDEARQRIHAAPMDGSTRMVLVWTDLGRPRALAVHSKRALLCWTDWGAMPKIECSTVAGENRTVLVNKDIEWPNGIAVDEDQDMVYWVDGRLEIIESVRLDGSGRRVVLRDRLQHLDGLSLLGPRLYWLDRSERAVASSSFDGTDRFDLIRNVRFIQDIKAVRRQRPLPEEGTEVTEVWTAQQSPCAHNRGGCSHLCFSTDSADYSCRCPAQLEMSADKQTCRTVPAAEGGFLVYGGSKSGLYRLSLTLPYLTQPLSLTPLRTTVSVSFDPVDGLLYRSDSESRSVWRSRLDGSMSEPVLRHGLMLPQALAVDYINRNLYWLDMVLNRLEVSRLDGSSRRVLVWRNIGKPYSITVEPIVGALFWFELGSEHGSEQGVIKSAWLDGSNVRSLVTKDLGQKVAIAVLPPVVSRERRGQQSDLLSQTRLFWTDSDLAKIESCDANGRDRRVLLQADAGSVDGGIVGAAVWDGRVYWAQKLGYSYALRSVNATTGADPVTVKSGLIMTDIMLTVAQYHHYTAAALTDAAAGNPCVPNYGGCSHLCLPPPITAPGGEGAPPITAPGGEGPPLSPCACPTHYTLDAARQTCLPPRSFLVYGVKSGISRLLGADSASTADCSDDDLCPTVELAIRGVRFVATLTYDPVEHIVYWLDKKSKKVWAAQEHAFKKQIVLDNPMDAIHPHSLALDYVTGQLFLSCAQHNTINVTQRGRTKEGHIVYTNLGCVVGLPSDSPRALAVHSPFRRLFFVNMVSPSARLESCRLDGSRRTVLINTGLTEPAGLTVDNGEAAPRLYWFDVRPNRIESATLDGRDRRVSVSGGLERVVSLAVLRGVLYWVDAGTNLIERGDVRYPNNTRTTVLSRLSDLVDIVAVDVDQAQQPQPCSRSGVNECSHVCLLTSANETAGVSSSPYSHSYYSAFEGSHTPKATTTHFSGAVTLPSNLHRRRSDNVYHDPYREHSAAGSGGEYNNNLFGGDIRSGSSSDPNIRRRSYGITVSSGNLMKYDSSRAAYGRSSYVSTTGSSGAGYYSPPVVEGACGCLYGEVLAPDGWSCEPCLQQHFTCSHDPLLCIPQHQRCDGVEQCWNSSDEENCPQLVTPCEGGACVSSSVSGEVFRGQGDASTKTPYIVGVAASVVVFLCVAAALVYYRRRPPLEDALALAATSAGLKSQQQLLPRGAAGKGGYRPPGGGGSSCQRLLPDSSVGCSVGCLNGSCGSTCAAPPPNGGLPSHMMASEMFSLTPASGAHASSSSSSTTHYPKETVNPPPTPTSRQPPSSVCYNNCYHLLQPSASSNLSSTGYNQGQNSMQQQAQASRVPHHLVYYRQGRCIPAVSSAPSGQFLPLAADHSYRHYKTRNRPPPPTPCSTDICDDSDINSTILVTSTASYTSDSNEQCHRHPVQPLRGSRHHNSPNAHYCSLSSLPRTHYYGDSEPEPPPPTPQLLAGRGSPIALSSTPTMEVHCQEAEDAAANNALVSPNSPQKDGLLITSSDSPGLSSRRFYYPPPPSPIASD